MAPRKKLKLEKLLTELLFIKDKAKDAGLTDQEIKELRFVGTNEIGQITGMIDDYELYLKKLPELNNEIVIIMLKK